MGLLVWQEFPLSSSGPDNEPPSDPETIEAWGEVARSYIRRRRHHASLLIWCGGNELQTAHEAGPGIGRPLTAARQRPARFAATCSAADPPRRFLPCPPSRPHFVPPYTALANSFHLACLGTRPPPPPTSSPTPLPHVA